MRIDHEEILIERGAFANSKEWQVIRAEIRQAIGCVVWPPGSDRFTVHPQSGKLRGQGNGVVPIKSAFIEALKGFGWLPEQRLTIGEGGGAGKIDAIKITSAGVFAVEWETGNISSSHRAMNKMALGIIQDRLIGGALVLPTRRLCQFLTDRIGNYQELQSYFPLWRHVVADEGVLMAVAVEHDREDYSVPRIPKGTDGRALL